MNMELQSGLSQVFFMDKLAKLDDVSQVAEQLKWLTKLLFHNFITEKTVSVSESGLIPLNSFRASLVGPQENISLKLPLLNQFINHFSSLKEYSIDNSFFENENSGNFPIKKQNTFFALPYQVASTASCLLTVPWIHPDSPKFKVLANIISTKYLHREIREKNGAYGGGATFASSSGILSFYSYRDRSRIKQSHQSFCLSQRQSTQA